jgi:hypothetical protein
MFEETNRLQSFLTKKKIELELIYQRESNNKRRKKRDDEKKQTDTMRKS